MNFEIEIESVVVEMSVRIVGDKVRKGSKKTWTDFVVIRIEAVAVQVRCQCQYKLAGDLEL